jgi:hypothetical protein
LLGQRERHHQSESQSDRHYAFHESLPFNIACKLTALAGQKRPAGIDQMKKPSRRASPITVANATLKRHSAQKKSPAEAGLSSSLGDVVRTVRPDERVSTVSGTSPQPHAA